MLLHMKDYIEFKFWGTTFSLNDKSWKLLGDILTFKPDIVLAFNNMLPIEYAKELELLYLRFKDNIALYVERK